MEELANASLARYTTLKIGGAARRVFHPKTIDELVGLVTKLDGEPWYIIGGGSNLLVSSEGFDGTVIRTTDLTEIKQISESQLEAAAGARLPHLAKFAAKQGYSGLEFAVGIPGTVGGGVIMNAGAHGSCMANIVDTVTYFDSDQKKLVTLKNDEVGFVYRKCKLDPLKHVIVSAVFNLPHGEADAIVAKTKHNEEYRMRTQPIGFPNAGSTFKNPDPDRSAGLLLDKSGAKNMHIGKAAVSDLHANFVINIGGATSHDVANLVGRMQEMVEEQFHVRMMPEWKTLGKFTDEELRAWKS
ncbi:MAG: UDP-N-acetylmuramate dehydrogenase [Candidatus Melainabacteria bacterium]|nr:UDP-N-acetylmuramate dehydrogenase [Candidatus Melainabacteria bacterium]